MSQALRQLTEISVIVLSN